MDIKNLNVLNDVIPLTSATDTSTVKLLKFDYVVIEFFLNLCDQNAQNCLASCRIEPIDKDTAQSLVPKLCVPFNTAFYMPKAVNIHSQRYLQV